jgi:hypothetical protein
MIKQTTLLGHYVGLASNDDPAIFATSGFVAASTTRVPPQPLPSASMDWIDRGPVTGSVVVKVKALPKAVLRLALRGRGRSGDSACIMDIAHAARFEASHRLESDARRNLRISGSCAGPLGLHRLERSIDVHLRLTWPAGRKIFPPRFLMYVEAKV